MSFDDVNEAIGRKGGNTFIKLNKVSDPILDGRIVDIKVIDKEFGGRIVPNKNGDPRKEWLFTLDVEGEDHPKKWAAGETAQIAIKALMVSQGSEDKPAKLEKGGRLQVRVTKDSVKSASQAEVEVKYQAPKFTAEPVVEEDLPF